jgi:hypothetical protein
MNPTIDTKRISHHRPPPTDEQPANATPERNILTGKKFISCSPTRRSVRPLALNATRYFGGFVSVTFSRLSHGIRLVLGGGLVRFLYPTIIFLKLLRLRFGNKLGVLHGSHTLLSGNAQRDC